MLSCEQINSLIIIQLQMKILKANYLGRFTLESCQKVSIKDLLALVKRKLTKEILSMELD